MTFTASEATLDDLMHVVIEHLLAQGQHIAPTKGPALEVIGAVLELTDPLARLSRSRKRSRPFSALGELSWYLAGDDSLEHIAHYVPMYSEFASSGVLRGAYGPRLFGGGDQSQIRNVIELLTLKPDSRQAVVQLFDRTDLVGANPDVPCTSTLQFFARDGRLDLVVYMRSNDAYLGLPHDIFCFTMIQEIVARALGLSLGRYTHMVGSLHLYDDRKGDAQSFLEEGWHHPDAAMPSMPDGPPWADIDLFLERERMVREGSKVVLEEFGPGYWGDLARLLLAFAVASSERATLEGIRSSMSSTFYTPYLADRQILVEGRSIQ